VSPESEKAWWEDEFLKEFGKFQSAGWSDSGDPNKEKAVNKDKVFSFIRKVEASATEAALRRAADISANISKITGYPHYQHTANEIAQFILSEIPKKHSDEDKGEGKHETN